MLIEFEGHYALNVQGRLLAVGTEINRITFTISDTTGFYNPDTTLGGWYGIRFIDTPMQNDTSRIQYCNLQYGKAVGQDWFFNAGGAMCILHFDKVIISNCFITNCSAGGSGFAVGGALAVGWSDIQLIDNVISYNNADEGGAIHFYESDPILNNNRIEHNSAVDGGAIDLQTKTHLTISNNQIKNNYASRNGGAINIGGDSVSAVFNETIISNNSAIDFGGAINAWNCDLEFNYCSMDSNSSRINGGGINAENCNLIINNTNFSADTTTLSGGAIAVNNSELNVDNCNITDNGAGVRGGGIFSNYSNIDIVNTNFERDTITVFGAAIQVNYSDLSLNNCNLVDNRAGILGGGIHSDYSNINITNTTFERDTSRSAGGGIFTWQSSLNVRSCEFLNNAATNNGGAISSSNSNLKIDSCLFYQNIAENQGGALECLADTSGFVSVSQLEITNSKFEENLSLSRCGAALIEQYNSLQPLVQLMIDNCEFINNEALRVGAIRIGNISDFIISNSKFIGNAVTQHTASCTFASLSSGYVYNCLFAENVAGGGTSGGAGISNDSEVDFMNCTFVNNRSGSGGGIQVRAGSIVTLTNSILWGNYPDQISLLATDDTLACTLFSNYNDIQFGIDSVNINDTVSVVNWGVGNIDFDPLFADTLNNDFHLQDLSPCIATGIDSIEIAGLWYYAPLMDIEANPRPSPVGSLPDMGAYESQYPVNVENNNLNLPDEYVLYQNYPNPFNPTTKITRHQPVNSKTTLKVFDVLGNEVATLVDEYNPAGIYEIEFNVARDSRPSIASGVSAKGGYAGVYFYQLKTGNFVKTKKMLILK